MPHPTDGQVPHNDLQLLADDRMAEQYRDSTNLKAFIALVITEVTELQTAIWEMLEGFDLETANDSALDIIGLHVGLPRPLVIADDFVFFGYVGAPSPGGYGDLTMPELGGVYLSETGATSGSIPMENEEYRAHIKAKIIRNKSNANPEDILEIVREVIPSPGTTLIVIGTLGNIDLTMGRNLSTLEQSLFRVTELNVNGDVLIPRAVGVSIDYADAAGPF